MSECLKCKLPFEVTANDEAFYQKVGPTFNGKQFPVPSPTLCPLCRQQRRMSFRNERKLYNRKCDFSGRPIISIVSPDKPFKVYESKVWWSDDFDGLQYGRDFDFTRSFFEQWQELQLAVPRLSLFGKNNENSDYTNHADQLKNCYLVMNGGLAENCFYANWLVNCRDCIDCSYVDGCELAYQNTYCTKCYNCQYLWHSDNCTDSRFLYDCKGVTNSLLCAGLRNQSYCILNQQYSKEVYQEKVKQFSLASHEQIVALQQQFTKLLSTTPHRALFITNSESCHGQNITNSKNCEQCFYIYDSQDTKYCYNALGITDGYDVYEAGMECEMQIDTHACNRSKYMGFCNACYDNNSIWYCDLCHNSNNLFGCIGLKGNQYCILNKQYTKEVYEALVPRIIEHMTKSKEWGEFFPISLSPFAYNETLAQDAFPQTQLEATQQNWPWHQDPLGSSYQGERVIIPNQIDEVADTILEKILTCESCEKHYKIIRQELDFYRTHQIALPHHCIDCRYKDRTKNHYQFQLFSRTCSKCSKQIETTYKPDDPTIVYCEQCYLANVYK